MASHFEAIGFEFENETAFASAVERAVADGRQRMRVDGGVSALWRDASGASIAVHLAPDGVVLCAAPSFDATSRVPVRLNGVAPDPECRFCSVVMTEVLEDGEMLYPLPVQLENIDAALEQDIAGRETEVALAAFGEEVEVWPDEAAYEDASTEEPRFAPQSLIPSGLFTEPKRRGLLRRKAPDPAPVAHALMTGLVESAQTLRNAASGLDFVHARVATYGPVVDVVLSKDEVSGALASGNVVQGSFWLIGRLLGKSPEVAS